VRVLAGPGVRANRLPVGDRFRQRIAATGATYIPFAMPATHPFDDARPLRGLARGWTPKSLATVTAKVVPYRWSPARVENVAAELDREPTDVVAAEAAGVPAATLVHNTYHRPAPGLPPYGHGFLRARGPLGHLRDALANAATERIYRCDGLPPHNRARHHLGLRGCACRGRHPPRRSARRSGACSATRRFGEGRVGSPPPPVLRRSMDNW
jgi:hypothetical protein